MKILITNDDGFQAPGLMALRAALEHLGSVVVVAPDRPRSASGHSITLHKPLRISEVRLADGSAAYATNGTPSDCVVLAVSDLGTPDLVVSGINPGPNLGEDLTYSGTVSAAMEAAILGIQSFAISVASFTIDDYQPAASFSAHLARALGARKLPPDTVLNVNVPGLPREEIAGLAITYQGRRRYLSRLEKRLDPRGRPYYWLGGDLSQAEPATGSDVEAISRGLISITPVHLDLTNYKFLEELRSWDLSLPGRK